MNNEIPNGVDPLLRIEKVMSLTGLARSTLYREIKEGRFPPPIHPVPDSCLWPQSQIAAWIASHVNAGLPEKVSDHGGAS